MGSGLRRWTLALSIAAFAMGAGLVQVARAQDAAGVWHGTLKTPLGDSRLIVRIRPEGAGLAGDIMSPDRGGKPAALADVMVRDGRLSYAVPSIKATFAGQWEADRKVWAGQWDQGGPYPLALMAGDLPKGPVVAGLDGDWEAALVLPTTKLRLVLHVTTGPYGTVATLDSPDQIAFGMQVTGLERQGQAVAFKQTRAMLSYAGTLSADGETITGQMTQGATRPLDFTRRATAAGAPNRPQTPKPPFPYAAEEVAFESAPGVRLAGTLTLPPGKGPFPAAVLITGSGAQDRDETLLGHKPFAVLADDLTRRGIAVLRYDDRGFAKSTGDFMKATTQDFAVDAEAAAAYLRTRPEIDPTRAGLIGHSEGGVVAPMVAAEDRRIGFVVLIAGPAAPLRDALAAQRIALGPAMGANTERLRQSQALFDAVFAAMKGAKTQATAETRAKAILLADGAAAGVTPANAGIVARQISSDWYRALMDYDPAPALRAITAPVLAVNGSKDLQVLPDQNLPPMRAALAANRDATVLELPGLNHLLQTAPTGAVGEYADIEETIAPSALAVIGDWVVAHTRR